MDDNQRSIYERLSQRYAEGDVPWDDPLPPPEVLEHVPTLAVGRALDLGCGYGRATMFLASLGWEVDGVDFVPGAIAEAARRTEAAGLRARFHISPVTDLSYLAGPYDFVLDVGCCHNLDGPNLTLYGEHLCRLIRPDGLFLLFARMRAEKLLGWRPQVSLEEGISRTVEWYEAERGWAREIPVY